MRAVRMGSSTLGGYIKTEFPQKRGNAFTVFTEEQENKERTILNMYEENFSELVRREVIRFPVEIVPVGVDRATLVDPRIPAEWYHQ